MQKVKNAVVLGATGNMGKALVNELVTRGIRTVAFGKSENKLTALMDKHKDQADILSTYIGDAFQIGDLVKACQNADVIFHSVNIPYPEWEHKLLRLTDLVMQAASSVKAKVVVVDNVYPYGYSQMKEVTEEHPKNPHTKKGKLRLEMENIILKAHYEGTPALITRLPDFYGPDADNTLLAVTLKSIALGKSGMFIGKQNLAREFIYIPDGAKAIVDIADHDHAYGESWNIPGAGVITGDEIVRIAQEAAGHGKKSVRSIGRKMFRFLGLFNPMMKEVIEMLYLTEHPLRLSGEKYELRIGSIQKTPYTEGVRETIKKLMK